MVHLTAMIKIPILSRLSWADYRRLGLAVVILTVEGILRFVACLFPVSWLDFVRFRVMR